jgi:MFS family permease
MIGPIKLAPGVTPAQIAIFLSVLIGAMFLLLFIGLIQPYFLSEVLHVPAKEQGRLTGNLQTIQQLAVLLFITVSGALADVVGRRTVLVLAIAGYVIAYIVYPLVSVIWLLYVLRFLFGMANTGHTAGGQTLMVDLPDNRSRGKFIALMLIVQGVASAVLLAVGARVPGWMQASGYSASFACRVLFWAIAVLGLAAILVALCFFKEPRSRSLERGGARRLKIGALAASFAIVAAHLRRNPRYALVMVMGFVTRSDFVVMQAFLSLWVLRAASDHGFAAATALKTAGLLSSALQIATVLSPALFGVIVDRVGRSRALIVGCGATGLALISTSFVRDVFGNAMLLLILLIGITESAQTVAANAVLGEEAPEEIRGATVGVFVFLGSISVIAVNLIGGQLFDRTGYAAPFVLVGSLNVLFAIVAFVITSRKREPQAVARA